MFVPFRTFYRIPVGLTTKRSHALLFKILILQVSITIFGDSNLPEYFDESIKFAC